LVGIQSSISISRAMVAAGLLSVCRSSYGAGGYHPRHPLFTICYRPQVDRSRMVSTHPTGMWKLLIASVSRRYRGIRCARASRVADWTRSPDCGPRLENGKCQYGVGCGRCGPIIGAWTGTCRGLVVPQISYYGKAVYIDNLESDYGFRRCKESLADCQSGIPTDTFLSQRLAEYLCETWEDPRAAAHAAGPGYHRVPRRITDVAGPEWTSMTPRHIGHGCAS